MSKKYKNRKQVNSQNGAFIPMSPIDPSKISPYVMTLGLEYHPNGRLEIPHIPISENCYFVDLKDVVRHYQNQWFIPLLFAQLFVNQDMRAFVDNTGVIIESALDEQTFTSKFHTICMKAWQMAKCSGMFVN